MTSKEVKGSMELRKADIPLLTRFDHGDESPEVMGPLRRRGWVELDPDGKWRLSELGLYWLPIPRHTQT